MQSTIFPPFTIFLFEWLWQFAGSTLKSGVILNVSEHHHYPKKNNISFQVEDFRKFHHPSLKEKHVRIQSQYTLPRTKLFISFPHHYDAPLFHSNLKSSPVYFSQSTQYVNVSMDLYLKCVIAWEQSANIKAEREEGPNNWQLPFETQQG